MSVLDYSKWDNIDTDSESDPGEEIEAIGAAVINSKDIFFSDSIFW